MTIVATLENSFERNNIVVETNGDQKQINIPSKPGGYGSSVNGGEILFLALATCFCNDLYREAARRQLKIHSVTVSVSGNFGKEGDPASNISYTVDIKSDHLKEVIQNLISDVDKIAEVHNTLRRGVTVDIATTA